MIEEKYYSPKEVADLLQIKKTTVYDMIKRGDLSATKLGKQFRISEGEINRILSGNEPAPTAEKRILSEQEKQVSLRKNMTEHPIILCGQDMILDLLANDMSRSEQGTTVLRSYMGSYNGIYELYRGNVDVATAHLWDEAAKSYNLPYIQKMMPGMDAVVIHLFKRWQGFYVKKGNPKNIHDFADLRREDLTIVNREPGSGSRVLLDEKLRALEIKTYHIKGYQNIYESHLELASAVKRGEGDVAVGTQKHALSVEGIDFIPLQEESYDMVFRKEDLRKPEYQSIIKIVQSEKFRKQIDAIGGYDVTDMGKEIK